MILYTKIIALHMLVYLKVLEIIRVIFSNIDLGDIASVLATVIFGVLGYRYTKIQDKKVDEQNKTERLAKYQSTITVDDEATSSITLDIATWHNYETINQYKNVLVTTSKEVINGLAYAFDFKIMFKCFSDVLPSMIRIKEINMYDTPIDQRDRPTNQLFLTFRSKKYEFKSLAFDKRKILPMTCLCCITKEEYEELRKHDYNNKNMNIQIFFEVKNQFNVITELNLRAVFNIEDSRDVGTDSLGGQQTLSIFVHQETQKETMQETMTP